MQSRGRMCTISYDRVVRMVVENPKLQATRQAYPNMLLQIKAKLADVPKNTGLKQDRT